MVSKSLSDEQFGDDGKPKILSAYKQKKLLQATQLEQGIKPEPGRRGRKRLAPEGVEVLQSNV